MVTTTSGPVAVPPPPGWKRDPYRSQGWRWWSGQNWTVHTSSRSGQQTLPWQLNWATVIAALLSAPGLGYLAGRHPLAFAAVAVPLASLLPIGWFLARDADLTGGVAARSVLWGMFVATSVAGLVNSSVAFVGGNAAAAVLSAPLVEELFKVAIVVRLTRRREINGVYQAVACGFLSAAGFAVVEDFQYFTWAADSRGGTDTVALWSVVVARGVLTVLLHPLFTIWAARAAGQAADGSQRSRTRTLVGGYALAAALHAGWNGVLAPLVENASAAGIYQTAGVYLFVTIAASVATIAARRSHKRHRDAVLAAAADYYRIERHHWQDERAVPRRERRRRRQVRAALATAAALETDHWRGPVPEPAAMDRALRMVHRLTYQPPTQTHTPTVPPPPPPPAPLWRAGAASPA